MFFGGKRGQTMVSAVFACITRGLGLVLRLVMSRFMGAEAMGILEMSAGVHHLISAPAAFGYPGAVSRMTALEKGENQGNALYVGLKLAVRRGLALAVLLIAASPFCAFLMGDLRTLPGLLFYAPALPFISMGCVMDAYQFGKGRAFFPAAAECTEQIVRVTGMIFCLYFFPSVILPVRAALPVMTGVMGELFGCILMMYAVRGKKRKPVQEEALMKRMESLAAPLTAQHTLGTMLHAMEHMFLPRLLVVSGFSAERAASAMGLFHGMALPLLYLPGIVTGAICALGGPAAAGRKGESRKKLIKRLILWTFLAGFAGSFILYTAADIIALRLFRQPPLASLLRILSPCALLFSMIQLFSSLLTGLGMQRQMLRRQLLCSGFSLLCTLILTPLFGITGVCIALVLGSFIHCAVLLHGGQGAPPPASLQGDLKSP